MKSLYLCSSHEDHDTAAWLAKLLRRFVCGWVRFDEPVTGPDFPDDVIARAIRESDAAVFLITPAATCSVWVMRELSYLAILKKPIVPVLLGPAKLFDVFRPGLADRQALDWEALGDAGLVRALREALPDYGPFWPGADDPAFRAMMDDLLNEPDEDDDPSPINDIQG